MSEAAGAAASAAVPAEVAELAAELLTSIRLMVAAARKARPEGELSAPEISALLRIKRAGETTSGALARLEGISPQAMGVTIASLEAHGLVAREKDAEDGRRMLLRVTDAGHEVIAASRDSRTEAIARLIAERLTSSEIETLRAAAPLLDRLAEGL